MTLSLFDLSSEETQAVHENITYHHNAITILDSKISSLLASIDSLRKVREEHLGQLRKCQSVLTLARRLPADLLGYIFEYCVAIYPMAPLVVSQVCTSWRLAAHTNPHIWSSLIIDCGRHHAANRTAYWLKMSGDYFPLRIRLLLRDTSLQSVIHVLIRYASRWQHFAVDAILSSQVRDLLTLLEAYHCSFPALKTIDLTIREETEDIINFVNVFSTKTSPLLFSISLYSESLSVRLPSHLTTLSLSIPTRRIPTSAYRHILQLLRPLPQLINLSLDFTDGSFVGEELELPEDGLLIMSHLKTVALHGCHPLFEILAYLTLPALCNLALRETGRDSLNTTRLGPWFLDMISRSLAPIATLELHSVDITEIDFVQCFMLLPTLRELLLHDSEISNNVFDALTTSTGYSWLCPKLRRIDLRWCSHFSGAMLVELVTSRLRCDVTANIIEIVVMNCSGVREEHVLSLASLVTGKCRLKHSPEDFCYYRGCCVNTRYRHRFLLRHLTYLKKAGLLAQLVV